MYSNISVLYTLYKNTLLSLCHNFKSAFFHYQYLFYKLKKYPCIFNNFIFCVVVDNQFAYLYNVTCNKNRLVLSLEITSANGQETNKHVMENVCFRYLKLLLGKLDYIQKMLTSVVHHEYQEIKKIDIKCIIHAVEENILNLKLFHYITV